MVTFAGMQHIHLKVGDIERSVRFYEEGFGMTKVIRNITIPAPMNDSVA